MTTQAQLHRLANQLEELIPLLRKPGAEALTLAADWAGRTAGTAAQDGSRSTAHNDLSSRITGPDGNMRIDPQYLDAHQRMTDALDQVLPVAGQLVRDFTYCTRAVKVKREAANRLDRINSKSGECEACYPAGRPDSYQHGTLEAVVLTTFTTNDDGEIVHEQLDLCHKCKVRAVAARVAAREEGLDWDHEEWMTKRIKYLVENPMTDIGAGAPAA